MLPALPFTKQSMLGSGSAEAAIRPDIFSKIDGSQLSGIVGGAQAILEGAGNNIAGKADELRTSLQRFFSEQGVGHLSHELTEWSLMTATHVEELVIGESRGTGYMKSFQAEFSPLLTGDKTDEVLTKIDTYMAPKAKKGEVLSATATEAKRVVRILLDDPAKALTVIRQSYGEDVEQYPDEISGLHGRLTAIRDEAKGIKIFGRKEQKGVALDDGDKVVLVRTLVDNADRPEISMHFGSMTAKEKAVAASTLLTVGLAGGIIPQILQHTPDLVDKIYALQTTVRTLASKQGREQFIRDIKTLATGRKVEDILAAAAGGGLSAASSVITRATGLSIIPMLSAGMRGLEGQMSASMKERLTSENSLIGKTFRALKSFNLGSRAGMMMHSLGMIPEGAKLVGDVIGSDVVQTTVSEGQELVAEAVADGRELVADIGEGRSLVAQEGHSYTLDQDDGRFVLSEVVNGVEEEVLEVRENLLDLATSVGNVVVNADSGDVGREPKVHGDRGGHGRARAVAGGFEMIEPQAQTVDPLDQMVDLSLDRDSVTDISLKEVANNHFLDGASYTTTNAEGSEVTITRVAGESFVNFLLRIDAEAPGTINVDGSAGISNEEQANFINNNLGNEQLFNLYDVELSDSYAQRVDTTGDGIVTEDDMTISAITRGLKADGTIVIGTDTFDLGRGDTVEGLVREYNAAHATEDGFTPLEINGETLRTIIASNHTAFNAFDADTPSAVVSNFDASRDAVASHVQTLFTNLPVDLPAVDTVAHVAGFDIDNSTLDLLRTASSGINLSSVDWNGTTEGNIGEVVALIDEANIIDPATSSEITPAQMQELARIIVTTVENPATYESFRTNSVFDAARPALDALPNGESVSIERDRLQDPLRTLLDTNHDGEITYDDMTVSQIVSRGTHEGINIAYGGGTYTTVEGDTMVDILNGLRESGAVINIEDEVEATVIIVSANRTAFTAFDVVTPPAPTLAETRNEDAMDYAAARVEDLVTALPSALSTPEASVDIAGFPVNSETLGELHTAVSAVDLARVNWEGGHTQNVTDVEGLLDGAAFSGDAHRAAEILVTMVENPNTYGVFRDNETLRGLLDEADRARLDDLLSLSQLRLKLAGIRDPYQRRIDIDNDGLELSDPTVQQVIAAGLNPGQMIASQQMIASHTVVEGDTIEGIASAVFGTETPTAEQIADLVSEDLNRSAFAYFNEPVVVPDVPTEDEIRMDTAYDVAAGNVAGLFQHLPASVDGGSTNVAGLTLTDADLVALRDFSGAVVAGSPNLSTITWTGDPETDIESLETFLEDNGVAAESAEVMARAYVITMQNPNTFGKFISNPELLADTTFAGAVDPDNGTVMTEEEYRDDLNTALGNSAAVAAGAGAPASTPVSVGIPDVRTTTMVDIRGEQIPASAFVGFLETGTHTFTYNGERYEVEVPAGTSLEYVIRQINIVRASDAQLDPSNHTVQAAIIEQTVEAGSDAFDVFAAASQSGIDPSHVDLTNGEQPALALDSAALEEWVAEAPNEERTGLATEIGNVMGYLINGDGSTNLTNLNALRERMGIEGPITEADVLRIALALRENTEASVTINNITAEDYDAVHDYHSSLFDQNSGYTVYAGAQRGIVSAVRGEEMSDLSGAAPAGGTPASAAVEPSADPSSTPGDGAAVTGEPVTPGGAVAPTETPMATETPTAIPSSTPSATPSDGAAVTGGSATPGATVSPTPTETAVPSSTPEPVAAATEQGVQADVAREEGPDNTLATAAVVTGAIATVGLVGLGARRLYKNSVDERRSKAIDFVNVASFSRIPTEAMNEEERKLYNEGKVLRPALALAVDVRDKKRDESSLSPEEKKQLKIGRQILNYEEKRMARRAENPGIIERTARGFGRAATVGLNAARKPFTKGEGGAESTADDTLAGDENKTEQLVPLSDPNDPEVEKVLVEQLRFSKRDIENLKTGKVPMLVNNEQLFGLVDQLLDQMNTSGFYAFDIDPTNLKDLNSARISGDDAHLQKLLEVFVLEKHPDDPKWKTMNYLLLELVRRKVPKKKK